MQRTTWLRFALWTPPASESIRRQADAQAPSSLYTGPHQRHGRPDKEGGDAQQSGRRISLLIACEPTRILGIGWLLMDTGGWNMTVDSSFGVTQKLISHVAALNAVSSTGPRASDLLRMGEETLTVDGSSCSPGVCTHG